MGCLNQLIGVEEADALDSMVRLTDERERESDGSRVRTETVSYFIIEFAAPSTTGIALFILSPSMSGL